MLNFDNLEGAGWLAAAAASVKGLSYFRRDKNKEMEVQLENKKLDIQLDEQNSLQDERLLPMWKELFHKLDDKLTEVEKDLRVAEKNIAELIIELFKAETKSSTLEDRIKVLEVELYKADLKHCEDARIIAQKETEIVALKIELGRILAEVTILKAKLASTLAPPASTTVTTTTTTETPQPNA